ncbi:hypothetical protein NE236_41315 [Actinoallomurus purpureus]|uniref:aggregation-promoting factor C-terminal-like domain-containing protein n=1 Tax=Actinoallomurus purpureus TaxID=478114 RepID=UPI00209214C7|nr:Hint domain-containing protein [Actinoallomurus purpureus]MCO6011409.1 hypothetical protein [Actinoallomurus purpureus]
MPAQAGTAYIPIRPDLTGFHKTIQTELNKALGPIVAKIGEDIGRQLRDSIGQGLGDPLKDPLEESKRKQQPKAPRDGEEIGGAFAAGFKRRLTAAFKSLPKAEITADSSEADRTVAELRARMEELSKKTIGVDVDAGEAIAELAAIKRELEAVSHNASIHVQADTAAAIAQLDAVQAEVDKVTAAHANVQVDADTAGADAELAATDEEVKKLDGRTAHINIDVTGALSSLGLLAAKYAVLFPALSSLGVAAGASLAAVAAGAAGAGVGLAGFGAVAMPAIVRIKDALQAQTQAAQQSAAAGVQAQQRALTEAGARQQLAAAIRNEAYAHQQALDQVRNAEQQLTAAQQSAVNAQRELTQARLEARRTMEDLRNQVIDAGLAVEQDTLQVDAARLSMQQLATAAAVAANQVSAAQTQLNAALAAQQQLAGTPGASDADKAAAQVRVTAAQAALKAAQNQQRAADLAAKKAELNYRQAVQQLREQQLQLRRLQQDERAAAKAGVDGSSQVVAARQRLAQANLQVQNSERALAQARANVARADQQAADQVAAARRAMIAASLQGAAANNTLATAMGKLSPAARDLMTAWQGFSRVYQAWQASLEPAVLPVLTRGLTLLRGVFPLLTPAVRGTASALNELLSSAQRALGSPFWQSFATTIGGLAHGSVAALGSTLGNIATGLAGIIQAAAPFAPIVLGGIVHASAAFSAFGQNLSAFQPIIGQLIGGLGRIVTGLEPALRALLGAVGQVAAPVINALAQVAGALGAALAPIFRALAPLVTQLVAALAPLLVQLINGLQPILLGLGPILSVVIRALQPVIAALLSGLQPAVASLVPVVALLVGAIARVLPAITPILPPLGQLIAHLVSGLLPILTPLISMFAGLAAQIDGSLVQALITAMPSIQQIVLAIAQLLPPLFTLVPILLQVYTAFIPLIPPVAQLAATLVTALLPVLKLAIGIIAAVARVAGVVLVAALRLVVGVLTFVIGVLRPILAAIGIAIRAVGTAALWLWNNAIKPAFTFISIAARLLAAIVLFAVIAPIVVAFKVLSAAALWLWHNAIVPAFNGMRLLIAAWWVVFIRPIFNAIRAAVRAIGSAFTWLWHNVAVPAWRGIQAIILTQWRAIKTVFAAIVGFLRDTLGPIFRWLWHNVVSPVWNGIKSAISTVWETGIRPVFNAVKTALGQVGHAFEVAASAIRIAWNKVKGYASAPIHFVVETVYNQGIVGMWNKVMGWLHLEKTVGTLTPYHVPGLASGGELSAAQPIRPMVTNGPMAIVGEGRPQFPEYVIPTDPRYRARAQGLWAAAGGDLQMLAQGGIIGGILNGVKKAASSIFNLGKDALGLLANPKGVFDKLAAPILGQAKGLGTSDWGKAAAAIPPKLIGEVWTAAKQIIETFKSSFGGGAGAQAMVALARGQVGYREGANNSNKYSAGIGQPAEQWCFAAGTLVDTPNGLRPIEEIQPGSTVLTPSGRAARTSALLTRRKELLQLTALGVPDTLVTEDHPYWAMRRTTPAKHKRRLDGPTWTPAGELKRGDMIALPIPAEGRDPFDPALAYVFGMYLADGHRLHRDTAHGVQFSDEACERERILAALKAAGNGDVRVTENRTCLHFTVYDDDLYDLCGQFGDLAHGKQIPGEVFTWDRAAREALLDGYLAGDGSFDEANGFRATTVSRALAIGLGKLVRSLGHVPNIHVAHDAGEMTIEGRQVSVRKAYLVKWKPGPIRRRQHFEQDGYLWVPVRSVSRTGRLETVYDLTVPGEHAFVADGAAVHNCADFIDWLAQQTGNSKIIPKTPSAPGMAQGFGSRFEAGSSGVMPGDIVFYSGQSNGWGGIGHVGIAVSGGNPWQSVEGNYGDRVALVTRSSAQGHAHPAYPVGAGPGGSLIHASSSAAQAWAQQALMGYGWGTAGQYSALIRLWNRESGWRWNATNPSSGAYGIPQSLPASKMASAGSDWRDNAATQMRWGLNYIRGRYGSPAAAWSHEVSSGWYDDGGWLQPGLNLAYNATRKPEPVFSPTQWADISSLTRGGDGASHVHYEIYPQRANFSVQDLQALQRRQEAQARVGRPR